MAVEHAATGSAPNASGRRISIAFNVAVAILAAALTVAAVNWIASLKSYRKDLADSGNYGLSERTRHVFAERQVPDVAISMLYAPDEENETQRDHIARLRDYFDELTRFDENVAVTHVATDSQRERLVARISTTFGSEADEHQAVLKEYDALEQELKSALESKLGAAREILAARGWLADFPVFASIINTLEKDLESLNKAREGINELTSPDGIPRFGDAARKAGETIDAIKGHLEAVDQRLGDLAGLADETAAADSRHLVMLRDVAQQARQIVASLRETIGAKNDPMPDNPAAALKAFADRSVDVDNKLKSLVSRVDAFAQAFPMVTQHPDWAASVQIGPLMTRMDVADVLQQAGQSLGKTRLVLLGVIDTGDAQQLAQAVREARETAAVFEQNADVCEKLLTDLAANLARVDDASKALMAAAAGEGMFGELASGIGALSTKIEALPELKLASAADELKEPNIVVVEANDKIRVLGYDDVFPIRESVTGQAAADDEVSRTFNGDSAISSAVLAMTSSGPFATIVLTAFEPPAPPQQNQFMPPPQQSWVPSTRLSKLRARLESANFKVIDWNLATTPTPPPPEEGTGPIYVVLPPPPPSPPNPFGGGPAPDQIFGDKQRAAIQQRIEDGASLLFLATWEVRSAGFFGGPPTTPPYGYAPLLESEWGIRVDNSRRITWVVPYRRKENSFQVDPRRFMHMPANGFSSQPIGKPLRGTRMLITDACPLGRTAERPEGVTLDPILEIPDAETYCGASLQELLQIIQRVEDPSTEGVITMVPPPARGPFTVAMAAERKKEDGEPVRMVVLGFGASVRDDYLTQPVLAAGEALRLDPPPTENVDFMLNARYWLDHRPELIGRGPVPVPRIGGIDDRELKTARVLIWGAWPGLIFALGIVVWYVRRR
jgi:hypothetical protein